MPLLTIEDIRNPKRNSGFNHVNSAGTGRGARPSAATIGKWWRARAYGGKLDKAGTSWIGPMRSSPEEAAQDYCDHVNGNFTPVAFEQWDTPEIDMGNGNKRHAPKSESVRVVRKKFTGPHDVYDIEFLAPVTGEFVVRKVGITARGHGRYNDIAKTFGFTIRPLAKAITYPTEKAARAAEDILIAKLCADPKWKRVGKEAFVPVKRSSS